MTDTAGAGFFDESSGAYNFLRLRRRIRRNPRVIAEDDTLRGHSALNFAAAKVWLALGVAAVMTAIFGYLFGDLPSIWDFDLDDAVTTLALPIRTALWAASIPLAALISAAVVAGIGTPRELRRAIGGRELRRRFLLSEGAVGLWPTIFLTAYITLSLNVIQLKDLRDFDLLDRLSLKSDLSATLTVLFTIVALIFLANVIAFLQTVSLFARSANAANEYRFNWGIFGRSAVSLLFCRALVNGLLFAFVFVAATTIASFIYLAGLYARESIGLDSGTHSSQALWSLQQQFGAEHADRKQPIETDPQTIYIEFASRDARLNESQAASLAQAAVKWRELWRAKGFNTTDFGHITIIGYVGPQEVLGLTDDQASVLVRHRTSVVAYVLAKNGVPPAMVSTIITTRGFAGVNFPAASIAFSVPKGQRF